MSICCEMTDKWGSMVPEVLFLVCSICQHQDRSNAIALEVVERLTKQIGPRATQIDNFGTSITVLLQTRALEAVECVRDSLSTAHDALVLVVSKRALVTYPYESGRSNVGIADRAFAIAFVAEAADGYAGLLAAHYQVAILVVSGILSQVMEGKLTDDVATLLWKSLWSGS